MKTTVRERLHKVHNYYWYTQFQMLNEAISDVSSSEEEEKCEYLDSKPDGDDSDEASKDESEEDTSEESSTEETSFSE